MDLRGLHDGNHRAVNDCWNYDVFILLCVAFSNIFIFVPQTTKKEQAANSQRAGLIHPDHARHAAGYTIPAIGIKLICFTHSAMLTSFNLGDSGFQQDVFGQRKNIG